MKREASKKFILNIDDPCPCGSSKPIRLCHFDSSDGQLRKKAHDLTPPGHVTAFSHPKCYLRGTQNCSEQISREHYISRSVLEKLGGIVHLSGAHWLDSSEVLETAVGNLTAKILCKRHNESLSPLDAEAGLFFAELATAIADLNRKTLSRKPIFHLISGDLLELWMLKVACGHYFGIGAVGGERISQKYEIDLDKVVRALYGRTWDARGGLYFKGSIGDKLSMQSAVSVGALLDERDRRIAGVRMSLLGLELDLVFDASNAAAGEWTGLVRHPTELVWQKKLRRHSFIITWPMGTPERSVTMTDIKPRRIISKNN